MKYLNEIKQIEVLLKTKMSIIDEIRYDKNGYTKNEKGDVIGISLTKLNISNIEEVVEILVKIKSLSKLNLADNEISNIDNLKKLNNLNELYLDNNKISDISSIRFLKNITHLNLSYNEIQNINIVTELNNLYFLWLSSIGIQDINFLKGLENLVQLGLGGNKISTISTLKNFTNLIELNLVHNKINSISALKNLVNLKYVSLNGNNIKLLPKVVFLNLINIDNWEDVLKENNLKSPPRQILQQGKNGINDYFEQIQKEKGKIDYLFEAKLLVIGEGGTGKTTFTRKMLDSQAKMPKTVDTTLGIEVGKWSFNVNYTKIPKLGKVDFNVNLWDFGGQKIYQGTHQIFFTNKSFYVLLTDTRENKTDFSYWLNTVQQLSGEDSSLIIIVNKKYGHENRFDESGYRNYFGALIKDVIEIDLSCSNQEIKGLQEKIKFYLKELSGIGDPLPPSWINIRKSLNNETNNFISFDHFRKICELHGVKDASFIRTISGYFNRIGTFTHYMDDPLLQERIYLNSNWLVKTVYEVLDNDIAKSKKGRLSESDIKKIWGTNELQYEISKLTQLMQKFGLMYHIPNTNNYVVPAHLQVETPYQKWPYEKEDNILRFVYEFDKYMPQGIMSRLIVALNHHIKNHDLIWQKGLNIELNGAHAEILETYGSTNSFEIKIIGTNKIELLTIIRERFSEVLKPFNKLKYKQLIPCICNECKNSPYPAFHEYNLLLKFRERNIGSQCANTGQIISAEELLKITKSQITNEASSIIYNIKTVKIFLASSSELKKDRREFEIFINRENKRLSSQNIFLRLEIWEDFVDSMSQTRLQNEYNKAIQESDIFISLFFTKVGIFTLEEFNIAFGKFKENGKPLIYTFFKQGKINIDEITQEHIKSKEEFQKKLKNLGHFSTPYKSIEDLKYQFKMQLDKLLL